MLSSFPQTNSSQSDNEIEIGLISNRKTPQILNERSFVRLESNNNNNRNSNNGTLNNSNNSPIANFSQQLKDLLIQLSDIVSTLDIKLDQFWTSERLCVTLDQFRDMVDVWWGGERSEAKGDKDKQKNKQVSNGLSKKLYESPNNSNKSVIFSYSQQPSGIVVGIDTLIEHIRGWQHEDVGQFIMKKMKDQHSNRHSSRMVNNGGSEKAANSKNNINGRHNKVNSLRVENHQNQKVDISKNTKINQTVKNQINQSNQLNKQALKQTNSKLITHNPSKLSSQTTLPGPSSTLSSQATNRTKRTYSTRINVQSAMQNDQTLKRVQEEADYQMQVMVAELNDIAGRLGRTDRYEWSRMGVIRGDLGRGRVGERVKSDKGNKEQINSNNPKTSLTTLLTEKQFHRLYRQLKSLSYQMHDHQIDQSCLEDDLRKIYVEVVCMKEELRRQIQLVGKKGVQVE